LTAETPVIKSIDPFIMFDLLETPIEPRLLRLFNEKLWIKTRIIIM